ncbi:MAG TPA: cyclodeaminase/cyclohydrolase family protein [Phycisphaerae bacterium]|nr:cyclodeaminase/cyclohydrolase family protein [Phycisphaerae bacterium]
MPDLLNLSLRDFLAATAAKEPTPGGGSVASLCAALAAALAAMALRFTAGKKKFAPHEPEIQSAIARLDTARALLEELIAEDIAAYESLSALLKLSEPQRLAHPDYTAIVVAAIRAPETAGAIANDILHLCQHMLDKTSKFLISDLGIAAAYAHATIHAAELNVRINLPLLPNPEEAAAIKQRLSALSLKSDQTYADIRNHLLRVL